MTEALLQIENLSCGYHGKMILQDIDLCVAPGEIVSIIGPNGSGKTTLLRTMSNILPPEKGDILIRGRKIADIPRKELAGMVAVVAQSVDSKMMTVAEYVLLGRLPYFRRFQFIESKTDEALAEKYMKLTDTYKFRHALMSDISGGERQLASIARALVQEPSLLLLDEPTSHLDITHQAQILGLIHQLNQDLNLTVIMVVHDLNLAAEYSGRLVLLDKTNGRVYRSGTPEQVITRESVENVYGAPVLIGKNPVSGKPCVFLVSRQNELKTEYKEI